MNKQKINYIIYAVIVVFTLFIVFFAKKLYENGINEKSTKRINSIYEIKEKDLDNYIIENPNIVIYMSNSKDESLVKFEKEFDEYVKTNNLNKNIVYIDLKSVSKNFSKNIKNKLNINSEYDFNNKPNMIILEDSEVKTVLYYTEKNINIEDVKLFLRGNEE